MHYPNQKCSGDRRYDPGIRAEENTVMIGGIDPEPRCGNSKSLPALKRKLLFLFKKNIKEKNRTGRKKYLSASPVNIN
jgi:hypothetical protein